MKFSIKDFFTFTKEILNGKLHFLCSEWCTIIDFWHGESLREKCPNTEFFLACVFPHSDRIFPTAGKYGPEKTPYLDNFHAVNVALLPTGIGLNPSKKAFMHFSEFFHKFPEFI